MSSDDCPPVSVVGGEESFGNEAVPDVKNNTGSIVPWYSKSSLDSNEESASNEQFGTFFIGYKYMDKLSLQDMNVRSRGPKFFCYLCEYYLHTRLSMITHMKMHRLPFCPVCFGMFHQASDVNYHMVEYHPELTQIEGTPILDSPELPCAEDSFAKMEAPPNSPESHSDNAQLKSLQKALESNNNTISSLLAERLRAYQQAVDMQETTADDQSKTCEMGATTDANAQKIPNDLAMGNERNLRNVDRKSSIGGPSGKVHKGWKPKSSPKKSAAKGHAIALQEDEHILKVTSRFGRAISLKVPQF